MSALTEAYVRFVAGAPECCIGPSDFNTPGLHTLNRNNKILLFNVFEKGCDGCSRGPAPTVITLRPNNNIRTVACNPGRLASKAGQLMGIHIWVYTATKTDFQLYTQPACRYKENQRMWLFQYNDSSRTGEQVKRVSLAALQKHRR